MSLVRLTARVTYDDDGDRQFSFEYELSAGRQVFAEAYGYSLYEFKTAVEQFKGSEYKF